MFIALLGFLAILIIIVIVVLIVVLILGAVAARKATMRLRSKKVNPNPPYVGGFSVPPPRTLDKMETVKYRIIAKATNAPAVGISVSLTVSGQGSIFSGGKNTLLILTDNNGEVVAQLLPLVDGNDSIIIGYPDPDGYLPYQDQALYETLRP